MVQKKVTTPIPLDEIPTGPTPGDVVQRAVDVLAANHAAGGEGFSPIGKLGLFVAELRKYAKGQGYRWADVEAEAREWLRRDKEWRQEHGVSNR